MIIILIELEVKKKKEKKKEIQILIKPSTWPDPIIYKYHNEGSSTFWSDGFERLC